MAKVTGIGGVFFKARDPKALAAWYATHLGVKLEDWGGVVFEWSADQEAQPAKGVSSSGSRGIPASGSPRQTRGRRSWKSASAKFKGLALAVSLFKICAYS